MADNPLESVTSITPSPVGRALIYGLIGVAVGVALGYGIAKILEEERIGHYRADETTEADWMKAPPDWRDDEQKRDVDPEVETAKTYDGPKTYEDEPKPSETN